MGYLCYLYLKTIVNLEVVHKLQWGIYVICTERLVNLEVVHKLLWGIYVIHVYI